MTVRGHIQNGQVVLDSPAVLPEGASVNIEIADPTPSSWADILKDFIGKAEGLPPDLALNHDHYLHGAPRR